MDLNDYQKICQSTASKFDNSEFEIATWGLGIAGEAGDVASCIKKTYAHKKDTINGIRENLGDTMWYIAMICNFYGWDLTEVLQENVDKLRDRYPNGFSFEVAQREMIDWNK